MGSQGGQSCIYRYVPSRVRRYCKALVPLCICMVFAYELTWIPRKRAMLRVANDLGPASEHKRVLVTGGAGFIGYHVAKALATDSHTSVVTIDNFNDYYDVRLKIDRAYELSQLGVVVYQEDLCTQALLFDLFVEYNFTHVAHMAAQAGVRYSLQNPLTYIHSNVECQLSLLDVLRDYKHTKLIYASSSSVYGKMASVPFRLSTVTNHPSNMYGATKKMDELLGLHYCQAYNISAVGLRFFTVYGPWGRPDMAVFKFAEAILNHKDLPLFQKSEDAPLERDFTYIDDVVDGILSALDYHPAQCGERFNLGFGHPLSVPNLVTHLEQQLGVKANVRMLPIPPSEILKTWADISVSTAILGFNPTINLTEGVRRFAAWYKGYRRQREDEDRAEGPTDAQLWFKTLTDDQLQRGKRYKEELLVRHNERLLRRVRHEKQQYLEWAKMQGHEIPTPKKATYSFFQGVDSVGSDIVFTGRLKNNIEVVRQRCEDMDQCVAFNSDGMVKKKVLPQASWTRVPSFTRHDQGLYVTNINVCKASIHDCDKNADCHPTIPAQYRCTCRAGYRGDGHSCLPLYDTIGSEQLRREHFPEYFYLLNITQMKKGKHMVFVQGLNSPGGDFMVAEQFADHHQQLQDVCRADPICIGVNTNGVMKKMILPRTKWVKWTEDPQKGIYVYDVDYCLLSSVTGCCEHTSCKYLGPADYACVCEPGYFKDKDECIKFPHLDDKVTRPREAVKREPLVPQPLAREPNAHAYNVQSKDSHIIPNKDVGLSNMDNDEQGKFVESVKLHKEPLLAT